MKVKGVTAGVGGERDNLRKVEVREDRGELKSVRVGRIINVDIEVTGYSKVWQR